MEREDNDGGGSLTRMETDLYRKRWTVDAARGAVVLIHGQGEHSGRYEHAAAALNAAGYAVYSGDLPGHGRSGGKRGHIDRFEEYIDAAAGWIAEAAELHPGRPLFLLGHSVGGLIAARLLQTRPDAAVRLTGAILSSPAFRLRMRVPAWKTALGRRLDRVLPRLAMPSGLKGSRVTRDEDMARRREEDPLMVHVASVRFYNEMLRAQAAALAEAEHIALPILVRHGGADEIIEPEPTLEFGRRLGSADKDVALLAGLHHEIMNEPERDEVLRDIIRWMDVRSQIREGGEPH